MAKLSKVMEACLAFMVAAGGKLVRYPGGFWSLEGWEKTFEPSKDIYFGTNTINALLGRGLVVVVAEEGPPGYKWPTAVKLAPGKVKASPAAAGAAAAALDAAKLAGAGEPAADPGQDGVAVDRINQQLAQDPSQAAADPPIEIIALNLTPPQADQPFLFTIEFKLKEAEKLVAQLKRKIFISHYGHRGSIAAQLKLRVNWAEVGKGFIESRGGKIPDDPPSRFETRLYKDPSADGGREDNNNGE